MAFTQEDALRRREGIQSGGGRGQQGQQFGNTRDQTSSAVAPAGPAGPTDPFAGFEFPSFDFGGFESGGQSQEQFQAQLAEQAERDRVTRGENDRDDLYSEYLNSAGTATDFINSQINDERANAALIGVDYLLTDEIKTKRISDYFATIWGEGDQSSLEGLIGEFGGPSGFSGFDVVRGDASAFTPEDPTETTVGRSGGQRPNRRGGQGQGQTLSTDDDLGGQQSSILGS